MALAAALLAALALSAAHGATVYYSFEVAETYVDYRRPTINRPPFAPRVDPADLDQDVARHAQLVNDMFPGPLIEATEGDRIVIEVSNKMKETSTVIHWHGIHQRGTPFMDGTYMIAQCGIQPGENFTYDFIADPVGTKWWHSHQGEQYQMGVSGGLVVYPEEDPYADMYDSDQMVMLCDWLKNPDWYMAGKELSWDVGLINGQWGDGTPEYPWPLIRIIPNQCSRLRFVHHGAQVNGFEVSIYGHNMTIIALDGHDVEPYVVSSFVIYIATRVDVVVCGDQEPGSYAINMTSVQDDGIYGEMMGFLWYAGSPFPDENATAGPENSTAVTGVPTYDMLKTPFDVVPTLHLEHDDDDYEDRVPDADTTVTIMLGRLGTGYTYSSTDYQRVWEYPESPLQQTGGECGLREGTSMVEVPELGTVVEIVVENYMDMVHPWHLHGYQFWVVRQGYLWDDGDGGEAVNQTCELGYSDIDGYPEERAEPWWGCKYDQGDNPWQDWYPDYNTKDGLVMDSFPIPARTWTVFRVLADNPGFWGFHCHKVRHHGEGMATTLFVGGPDDQPTMPAHQPVCGRCARESEVALEARAATAEADVEDLQAALDDKQDELDEAKSEDWGTAIASLFLGLFVGAVAMFFGKPLVDARRREKFAVELRSTSVSGRA